MITRFIGHVYLATVFASTVAMVGIVVIGVFLRYVVQSPLVYSFDLSTLFFAWLVFLGLVLADQHKAHLGVDFFVHGMSDRAQWICAVISDLVVLAVALLLTWFGLELTRRTGLQITSMRISTRWLYAALPVGMGLFALWTMAKLVLRFAGKEIPWEDFPSDGKPQ